jgi:ABC-type lipoprotein release transport system permease subunit
VRKPIPFEGDMSNEKMERARILMKVEQYDQARALLETVEHPSAHEWLAKIDDLELGDSFTAHVQPKPKSMGYLMSFIALVAGVVSIIIMFGLIMGTISDRGSFDTMLFWVLVTLILLPVAYFTNKVGRRMRRT